MHDQLAYQAVVRRGNLIALIHVRVPPHTKPSGSYECFDLTGRRTEVVGGVFGVDATLDGCARGGNVLLLERQRFAIGDTQLPLNEIQTRYHLGYRMLDLDSRVDLEEVKLVVAIEHELDGSGAIVAHLFSQPHRGAAHFLAKFGGQSWSGRFFDDLLATPLNGALALEQVNDISVLIAENLHLDVAEVLDALFHIQAPVVEGDLRLGLGLLEHALERCFVVGKANAPPSATGGGFEHYRISDLLGKLDGVGDRFDRTVAVWCHWNVGGPCDLFGLDLVAKGSHGFHARSDEFDLAVAADLGEVRVFGEEPVARMNRLDVGDLRRCDDSRDIKVTVRRGGLSDADCFIGKVKVAGVAVGLGEDRNGLDREFLAGADDSQGYLAAVGNKNT